MTGECVLCGKEGHCETHHIIFRSQCTFMKNIEVNLIPLCPECHRNQKYGVHHNKKLDNKLKIHLQNELFAMFSDKKYFKAREIQLRLNCSDYEIMKICKTICNYRKGYEVEQLVRRLMSGRLYE